MAMTYHSSMGTDAERRLGRPDRRQRADRRSGVDRRQEPETGAGELVLGWVAEIAHGHVHAPRKRRTDRRKGERRSGIDRRDPGLRAALSREEIEFLLGRGRPDEG